MKTRILHTRFWDDTFISDLTPIEKLIFVYLLTNDKVNILGCYELPDKHIQSALGITQPQLLKAKAKFQKYGSIFFKDGWVLLRNLQKYEKYVGDKNETAKQTLKGEMSASIFSWYESILDTPIDTPIDTSIDRGSIPPINHKSEIISHKEGGLGETKFGWDWINAVDDETVVELATKFETTEAYVRDVAEKIVDYCTSKNKRYNDYKSTLRNWIRSDEKRPSNKAKSNSTIITDY